MVLRLNKEKTFAKKLQKFSLMSCCGYSSQFPDDNGVEIALVGRSNAGKSTVINRLLGAKMAHVSQRPGKTQTANFYGDTDHKIVDLPGVGYAKSSKQQQQRMGTLISDYFSNRKSLKTVIHCMDIRHPWQEADKWLLEASEKMPCRWVVLLNKADKLSKQKCAQQLQIAKSMYTGIDYVVFSAHNGLNYDSVIEILEHCFAAS